MAAGAIPITYVCARQTTHAHGQLEVLHKKRGESYAAIYAQYYVPPGPQ
jgi:hypothetical protein